MRDSFNQHPLNKVLQGENREETDRFIIMWDNGWEIPRIKKYMNSQIEAVS